MDWEKKSCSDTKMSQWVTQKPTSYSKKQKSDVQMKDKV